PPLSSFTPHHPPPPPPPFPYTTLFRSHQPRRQLQVEQVGGRRAGPQPAQPHLLAPGMDDADARRIVQELPEGVQRPRLERVDQVDRKSTRLNSSHLGISYAVFCLKKKI